jgi:hypothetical protein
MQGALRFLVMEFPSRQFVFTRFTAEHAIATIDVILEPGDERPEGRVHPAVFLVKGSAWREVRALFDELAATHGPPQVLRRDASGLLWLCRVDFREERLGTDAAALRRLQDHFGPPWLHHEQGVCHLRASLPEGTDSEHFVAELAGMLRATHVEAQVDVVELAPQDYGVWQDLLQASAGLAL